MISTLGKELKKLRIDLGITLVEMARKMAVSSAFLSSIETGRKRVPEAFLDSLTSAYPQIDKDKFEVLINQSRKEVRLSLEDSSHSDAMLATALARRFRNLSDKEKEDLMKFLNV